MRSPLDLALGRSLRNILNDQWDPIGVAADGIVDEYDSYIWPLLTLLRRKPAPTVQDVSDALLVIEREQMCWPGQANRAWAAAEALLAQRWRDSTGAA